MEKRVREIVREDSAQNHCPSGENPLEPAGGNPPSQFLINSSVKGTAPGTPVSHLETVQPGKASFCQQLGHSFRPNCPLKHRQTLRQRQPATPVVKNLAAAGHSS